MKSEQIPYIKMIVMDVDGTLTDGKIYMGINGEIMKVFSVKDGYAIKELLPKNGIIPIWITARKSEIVTQRAVELNVELVYQGVKDKLGLLKEIAHDYGYTFAEIAYMGDDINDIECMKMCKYSGCPKDAADEIRSCADYISDKSGGAGALRDFAAHVIDINKGISGKC